VNDAPSAGSEAVLHVRVLGRVQGVGFRWWAQQQALALGVRGWVCNRGDGSVELAAAGAAWAVEALHDALRQGPPHASVRETVALGLLEEADALPLPFVIRRDTAER